MIATLLGLYGRNHSQTRSSPFLVGYPVGPTLTSSRAFHGWTRKPPCFFGFAWWIKLVPGSFDVKPWSGPVLKKFFERCALFQRKRAFTECSSRASCYLEQKVGGSLIFIIRKTRNLFWWYVPCSPRAYIQVLLFKKNLDKGPLVMFSGSLLSVRGRW
jgi:hypothetical protein